MLLSQLYMFGHATSSSNTNTLIESYYEKVTHIDTTKTQTKGLLNKSFSDSNILNDYFNFKHSENDEFTTTTPYRFKKSYRGLRESELSSKKRLPEFRFTALKTRYHSKQNNIPLGVLQAKGKFFNSSQIEHLAVNCDITSQNSDIFSAGVLIKKVYSGTLHFEVVPELYYIQNPNQIKSVSIDFYDGNGFCPLDKESSFDITYDSPGEKIIAIKFEMEKKSFTSYSKIDVVTVNTEKPTQTITVDSSPSNNTNQQAPSESSKSSILDGYGTVYGGCDQKFDKPVIVVEGFDALNENFPEDLRRKYNNIQIEDRLRANGHDMVYFNFRNGGDDILKNAKVLEKLIDKVNALKVENNKIVVIGESMGGIVARVALRNMELNGKTHNVSHYISFDAPHKGANAPIGLQKLIIDLEENLLRRISGEAKEELEEVMLNFRSKAARQMLILNDGTKPHPDFNALQSELNRLGFPRQGDIRNIALTNGALDGSTDEKEGLIPIDGAKIFSITGDFEHQLKLETHVWSNDIGVNQRVSNMKIKHRGIVIANMTSHHNSDKNYDIIPGGSQDINDYIAELPTEFSININHSKFSFVPLFSSLASSGPTSSQYDLSIAASTLKNANYIPFHAYYGNSTLNTKHVDVTGVGSPLLNILHQEIKINIYLTTGCNVIPDPATPPAPNFNTDYYYTCQYGTDRTFKITNDVKELKLYKHIWKVTGPHSFTLSGDMITMNSNWPAGVYYVTLERSFVSGLGSKKSSVTKGFTIFSQRDTRYCGSEPPGSDDGDKKTKTIAESPLDTELQDSPLHIETVSVWPNPTKNKINLEYTLEKNIKVSVYLNTVEGIKSLPLFEGFQHKGTNHHLFDVSNLTNGIYILRVDVNGKPFSKKIIIN